MTAAHLLQGREQREAAADLVGLGGPGGDQLLDGGAVVEAEAAEGGERIGPASRRRAASMGIDARVPAGQLGGRLGQHEVVHRCQQQDGPLLQRRRGIEEREELGVLGACPGRAARRAARSARPCRRRRGTAPPCRVTHHGSGSFDTPSVWTHHGPVVDLTVVAIPGYFGSMGAEHVYTKRRRDAGDESMLGYEKQDTLASLAMGVGSLLAPLVMARVLKPVTPGRGRLGKALVLTAVGAAAATTAADAVLRRADDAETGPTPPPSGRRP